MHGSRDTRSVPETGLDGNEGAFVLQVLKTEVADLCRQVVSSATALQTLLLLFEQLSGAKMDDSVSE
eukprot:218506-Rhodomonas_salina.1